MTITRFLANWLDDYLKTHKLLNNLMEEDEISGTEARNARLKLFFMAFPGGAAPA